MLKDLEKLNPTQYNLIHAHTVFSGGYSAYQLHKRYGLPYFVAIRNTDVSVFFERMPHLRKLGVEIICHAEQVVFLSPVYKEYVLKKYIPQADREKVERKSIVIPNGISRLFFENLGTPKTIDTTQPVKLIYVGEINRNKNLELTIQAAELLREQGRDIRIIAVGKITNEKYYQILEETSFLTHYDRCPQEEVIRHLRDADIFVMPSHAETFGLVYAEAMSQGLPVIYTRGQGFDGQFAEGTVGYSVADTKATELAQKIEKICTNYEELSANCVRLVERFDWVRIAQKYEELYLKKGTKHETDSTQRDF